MKCNLCNGLYVGQSGRAINVGYKKHIRYIRTTIQHSHVQNPYLRTSINIGQRKHTTIIKSMSERNMHDLLGGTVYTNISSTESVDYQATG